MKKRMWVNDDYYWTRDGTNEWPQDFWKDNWWTPYTHWPHPYQVVYKSELPTTPIVLSTVKKLKRFLRLLPNDAEVYFNPDYGLVCCGAVLEIERNLDNLDNSDDSNNNTDKTSSS